MGSSGAYPPPAGSRPRMPGESNCQTGGGRGAAFSEWRRLRQTIALPVADHVSDAADLIRRFQAEALDYAIVGAATATATLAQSRLAHSLGMGGWSQTVAYGPGAALGLHVAACMPNLSQPYDMVGPMAWQDDLTNEPFEFANGAFRVPDRPGLGFTLNRDAAQQYSCARKSFNYEQRIRSARCANCHKCRRAIDATKRWHYAS